MRHLKEALRTFHPLPHRLENLGTFNRITFINDSAANHPQATLHALDSLHNVSTIFLGGQDRGFDFSNVIARVARLGIQNIVLFPDLQDKIGRLIKTHDGFKPVVLNTQSMDEAVQFAYTHAAPGSVCLLSPGAPSYTMFKNFPARAEAFTQAIHTHAQKKAS